MPFNNQYQFADDMRLVRAMQELQQEDLAAQLQVNKSTVSRWESGVGMPSASQMERFYSDVYTQGISLNRIKQQFYREDLTGDTTHLLFHGSKSGIEGTLRYDAGRDNNDMGRGFYCGESLMQSALFVANFLESCIYMLEFHTDGLRGITYHVDRDWMLTVAWFRGRFTRYRNDPALLAIIGRLADIDYIVAPIADNQMYRIIDQYIDGEITDEQCRHCLAATDLGMQYVMRTQSAVAQIELKERCYYSQAEREFYKAQRERGWQESTDKVKAARIKYRGKGQYIDEVFAL